MDMSETIFGLNLQEKMLHTTPPTSIKHRAFYRYYKNPLSAATLFGEIFIQEGMNKHMPIKEVDEFLPISFNATKIFLPIIYFFSVAHTIGHALW